MRRLLPSLVFAAAIAACRPPSEPAKPVDLLDLSYVVIAPVEEEELASPVSLHGDPRPALVAPTPAEFRYRVTLPERALLTFALGIADKPGREERALPGSRMHFEVRVGEEAPSEIVFERDIHVQRRDHWLEQTVDLGRFAGRTLWLGFSTSFPGFTAAEGEGALPIVGVFAEPVLHDRARYGRARGVVLVSIDTLRRDHVSLYGYPRRTTPGLEALAEHAVVFDDAVSTASWTLPAHASLFTSTPPSVHGATDLHHGLSPEWPNLARQLKDAGFTTQAMVTHLYLSKEYGFGEGFDRHFYLPDARAQEVTSDAVQFLEAKGDRDFFLFLHYYDPHWHYDPPPPYDAAFDPGYAGEVNGVWWNFKELDRDTIAPEDLHHIEALYDGEILYTDRELERLFQEMKRIGLFDASLVVVTSDHGEEFLDHGGWEHQKTLYEEQLRIPLLMKLPGERRGGERVSAQVSLVDVAPTISELLGLEAPKTYEGRSLLPAIEARGAFSPREAWSETEHTLDGSHKVSLRRGAQQAKAIFTIAKDGSTGIQLFDLGVDPKEQDPLDAESSREGLLRKLDDYLNDAAERRAGRADVPEVELDAEALERLRSLGYLR